MMDETSDMVSIYIEMNTCCMIQYKDAIFPVWDIPLWK